MLLRRRLARSVEQAATVTRSRDLLVVVLATGLAVCEGSEGPTDRAVPGDAPVTAVRSVCGTEAGSATGFVALHRYSTQPAGSPAPAPAPDRDEGSVAILHDRGDLMIRRNLFDLDTTSVERR